MRLAIIGNCGSGKTWLAKRISERNATIPVVHLDEIFWLPGGFNEKRGLPEASRLVETARMQGEWIVEGVYANLVNQFLPSAKALVWLDLPLAVCLQRLANRGSESKAHMGREQSEAGLRELFQWAETYAFRQDSTSHRAHLAVFDSFAGFRHKLTSESQVLEYLNAA